MFNLFDDDQTGHITLRNLKRVAKELGETMSDAELMEMIERADTDNDGEISPDEFCADPRSDVLFRRKPPMPPRRRDHDEEDLHLKRARAVF